MMAPSPAPKAPPRSAPTAPTGTSRIDGRRATRGIDVLVAADSRDLRTKNGARYPTDHYPNQHSLCGAFLPIDGTELRVYSNGTG